MIFFIMKRFFLTVDMEDLYFINKEHFTATLGNLVDLFKEYDARATFFVLAEDLIKYEDIVGEISKKHEIACHGLRHERIDQFRLSELSAWLQQAMVMFTESNLSVKGFRAPFNMFNSYLGPCLKKIDLCYDSSVCRAYFPGRYNMRHAPNKPYKADISMLDKKGKDIIEFPISSISLFKVPFGLSFMKAFPKIYHTTRIPDNSVFYMHTYDLVKPRFDSRVSDFFRIMHGINGTRGFKILEQLLRSDQKFIACEEGL